MAIFGFLVLSAMLFAVTGVYLIASVYMLGRYNIGGVPHTWKDRLFIIPVGIILYFAWVWITDNAPFGIFIK